MKKQTQDKLQKIQMQERTFLETFGQVIKNQEKNFWPYIQILARSPSVRNFKQKSKALLVQLSNILKCASDKASILRIGKFVLCLIMTGHFHILHTLDNYLLKELVSLSKQSQKQNVSCLKNIKDLDVVDPVKLKSQLSNEILVILANWFPCDLLLQYSGIKKISIYSKIVKQQKIKVKQFSILTMELINAVQKQVQQLNINQEKCKICMEIYKDLSKKNGFNLKQNQIQSNQQNSAKIQQTSKQDKQQAQLDKAQIIQMPVKLIDPPVKRQSQRIRQKLLSNKNKKLRSIKSSDQNSKQSTNQNSGSVPNQQVKPFIQQQKIQIFQQVQVQQKAVSQNNFQQKNVNFANKIKQKSKRRKIQLK